NGHPPLGGVSESRSPTYGFVVLRVNVSVLLYAPVRSGSLAPMTWVNVTGTASFEVGALHVLTTPRPCSGWASANAPLTSLPVLVGLGSATERGAAPARETTGAGG